MKWKMTTLLVLFGLLFWTETSPVQAATLTVFPGEVAIANNGRCSLREAIINANDDAATHADCVAGSGADTIQLATGSVYSVPDFFANADGPNGLPSITTAIVIEGNHSTITRSGTANYRLFHISATGDLALSNVTISNGDLSGFRGGNTGTGGGGGGGAAGFGGAFYNRGSLTLNSAIIAHNRATGGDGGTGGGTTNVRGGGGGGGIESAGTDNVGSGRVAGGSPNPGSCPAAGGDGGGGQSGNGFNGTVNACNGGFGGGGGGGGNASAQNGVGGTSAFGGGGGGRGRSAAVTTGGFGGGNGRGGGGGGLGAGGAIFNRAGTITVVNSVFANNVATGGLTGATAQPGTNGQGLGGAISAILNLKSHLW